MTPWGHRSGPKQAPRGYAVIPAHQLLEEAIVARDVAIAVAKAPSLPAGLTVMLQRMCQAWRWRVGQAWVPSPNGQQLVAGPGWSEPKGSLDPLMSAQRDLVFARGQGLPGSAWSLQQPIRWSHTMVDPLDPRRAALRRAGLRSSVAIPLLGNDDIFAVLEFFAEDRDDSDADLVDIMNVVAERLGPVIARKSTDDNVRHSEERLRRFIEAVGEAIVSFDSGGSLSFANGTATDLLGHGQNIVGRPIISFLPEPFSSLPPQRAGRVIHHLGAVLSRHARVPLLLQVQGREIPAEISATRDELQDQPEFTALIRSVEVGADPTAVQKLSRALRIERQTTSRLRAANEMKDTMLHAVSHELMDPLMTMRGLASLLEKDAEGETSLTADRRVNVARQLHAAGLDMRRILHDLLDVERLEQNIVEPVRTPTSLLALIWGVVERSEYLSDRKLFIAAPNIILAVDRTQVETIIANLLKNAAQYSPPASEIRVTLKSHVRGAVLSVVDHGPGVPSSQRRAIFRPFQRGGNGDRGGLGIGLSLVDGFARLHGGHAWADEAEGGGAAFHVLLAGPQEARTAADDERPSVPA